MKVLAREGYAAQPSPRCELSPVELKGSTGRATWVSCGLL